jgi:hypothetical protein
MKNLRNIIMAIPFVTAMLVINYGCTEDIMDDLNIDKSNALYAPAKNIIADIITGTAFSTVGGDFSLYASVYMEHEAGVHNQMYGAEMRIGEPSSSNTYNNVWGGTYTNIKNAKLVISKCNEPNGRDEGNAVTIGVAKLLLAYNAAILTDLFGDVPFYEAGEMNPDRTPKYMQPKIDKQETIYGEVMKLLDEAIVCFDESDAGVNGGLGPNDYIYGGNKTLWKKAAYGLKARYSMRLLGRSANKDADLQNILSWIDLSFANSNEELKFDQYDGDANVNPLFGFSYSRDALGASQSLLDKFVQLNDPRASQYFTSWYTEEITEDPDDVFTAPNGSPEQAQFYYDWAAVNYALTAPTQLLSYHEIQFIKAEALARLNKLDDAKTALLEAMIAAFANLEYSVLSALEEMLGFDGDIDLGAEITEEYFNTEVEARFGDNPLQEIIIQKYLAFAGASGESIEAYNDYRRWTYLENNFIKLANPLNTNKFPVRFSYGVDDVSNNPAVRDAYGNGQYVYTEKVWWAGGTR